MSELERLTMILLSAQVAGNKAATAFGESQTNFFPCGRVHLIVNKPTGKGSRKLLADLIATGLLRESGWGPILTNRVSNQAMDSYQAFYDAASQVLTDAGVSHRSHSYID